MTNRELAELLRKRAAGLYCLDCEHYDGCGAHGCNIMHMAADALGNSERHVEALQKEIEGLRMQLPRWIPVTERLPEVWRNDATAELVNYMIYSPDFGVDIGNYHAKAKKWLCMALPCTVTHWMPLPEGPET